VRLVTLDRPPKGRSGALIGDEVLDFGMAGEIFPLASWIPADMVDIIATGPEGLAIVKSLVDRVTNASEAQKKSLRETGALVPAKGTRLRAPVRPGIVFSHGRAYGSHRKEMGSAAVNPEEKPGGFLKNISAVIGPGAPIYVPPQAPDMLDFEGEISIVFGKFCHNVKAKDALDYVMGVTIVNDVSARDWVKTMKTHGNDINRMGKQLPSFCPLGPCIATKDEIADIMRMHVVTRLNGQVMQDSWTDDLIWNLPELIEYYSFWHPFRPGDVMTTGSPAGVGMGRKPPVFMKPGDVIAVTVDGVGTLENPIIAGPAK
jgi:acylpyruvate hydrolase